MLRVAVFLLAIFPLSVGAQNGTGTGQTPSFMVAIQRTPERDIEQALRNASESQGAQFLNGVDSWLDIEGAQRFREIGIRAREASEMSAMQGLQTLCNEQGSPKSRELLTEQLVAAAESEEDPWGEAVSEVFESFSAEEIEVLIRRAATLDYSGYDTDWEEFFQIQDPVLFLDQACSEVDFIANGRF